MREVYEEELRVAQGRGILSEEEARDLLAEGLRLGRSPLELLLEDGVISEDTLAAIQAAAHRPPAPRAPVSQTDVTRTFGPPAPVSSNTPTLTMGQPPGESSPSPQDPPFPVPGWERYQPVRFLGQGGMGRVYLAFDPLLRRNVALKFVRGDDPELLRRFLSEAQAQARVDHERVCKVYEVGEVQGLPFIAMQYVNGRSLLEVARELTLEQKVMVVQQATEGLHAAHRAGLIHRDIKPSNILVERGEDGQLKPYVMDFGLARDWQQEATATGTVLGTPHYMAPEQARGEVSRLDRRADVYSLGATLYVLLTGQRPIPGTNALEVLNNIATVEPIPPRKLDRNVPADLEAIVLKCLEREPSARYDSARALAEDLGRFLNGEPVQARAVGLWYRLRKRARKHWALVSVASVALVLITLALGQVVLARRETLLREHLARRFAELTSEVGSRARFMALSRLHDTTNERKELRARLGEIEKEMQEGGEPALGPGHHALGQGWLELGEPAQAREHLEAAILEHGVKDPRAAYALALAMGQLYREEMLSLGGLLPEQREARRKELARQYREPALDWLRKGQGAPVISTEYMEAFLALYEERYDEALRRLDAAGERLPWFYEAPKLRGDILHMRALERWWRAEHAQAREDLEAARRAYAQAADTAPSVPEVHIGLARVEFAVVTMQVYGSGGDIRPHIELGLEHLSRALRVAPDHAASRVLQAALYRRLAEHRDLQGQEVEESLRKAVESARRAVALEESPLQEERKELGASLVQWALVRQRRGLDSSAQLREAFDTLEGITPKNRDFFTYQSLGFIFKAWADSGQQSGADPLPDRGKAIEAFSMATQLNKSSLDAWLNLAYAHYQRATHPRATTVAEDLGQALEALERGRALNPRDELVYLYMGQLQAFRAQWLRNTGQDELPALAEVLAVCGERLALDSRSVQLYNLQGWALLAQARGAQERGEDPLPLLAQAQRAFEQARDLAPQRAMAYNNLSELQAQRAEYLHALGRGARPSAQAALQAAREAWQRTPEHAFPLINLGRASQLLAALTLHSRGDPRPHLDEATQRLHQALERAPGNGEAWLYLAETLAVQARWQALQGLGRDEEFAEAAQVYQQALALAERPLDDRLASARFYLQWALWRRQPGLDPRPPAEQGLELVEAVLTLRPRWVEAGALRAELQQLLAP